MSQKNLKYGIKVSKRDVVLETSYVVLFGTKPFSFFSTKIEAINFLSDILSKDSYHLSDFRLIKTQLIKF